jgi:hypothetical protein
MVKYRIMDKIDLLLAALPEELLDLAAPVGKGCGDRRRDWGGRRSLRCSKGLATLFAELCCGPICVTALRAYHLCL